MRFSRDEHVDFGEIFFILMSGDPRPQDLDVSAINAHLGGHCFRCQAKKRLVEGAISNYKERVILETRLSDFGERVVGIVAG